MAEVVSMIASLITIAALVNNGVECVKDLHRIPKEILEVQVSGSKGTISCHQ